MSGVGYRISSGSYPYGTVKCRKAPDEELLAVVETDACGADAIQVMTGCTFGKGNFLFKNYGKHAFSLLDRRKGKGLRVCLRPDAFQMDPEYIFLSEKVQKDEASEDKIGRFRQLQQQRVEDILYPMPSLCSRSKKLPRSFLPRPGLWSPEFCDFRGEATKMDLSRKIDGKRICIPCAKQHGFGNNLSE